MSALLKLLLAFFWLPVDDPADPADPADPQDPADPADPADPDDPDNPDDPADPDPADPADPADPPRRRESADARATREAAQESARLARETHEIIRRGSTPAPQSDEQRQFAAEEDRLKDPKATELERWQINSNRTLRQNNAASQAALRQAQDLSDRANFTNRCAENKRLASVKDEVEKRLAIARSQGHNPNREAIAIYVLGEKLLNAKEPGPKPAPKQDPLRARAPAARSDVRAKGPLTDQQKRERRLENQII